MHNRMNNTATACQIALSHGIIPERINNEWRINCPVCECLSSVVFDRFGHFRCEACYVYGEGELLDNILIRLSNREG